eukprot:CAMPEP_0185766596 /NCGR_PEP_ID=MMETSP1174-20130828/38521_1 /TAXON_ID=35687 /ORGANISM="Dictyocha speculum, Strain CCMP1381" /LENGTH=246 /DNA_ID=CAMNT_0028450359 /DNA_START=217 /DNA_END=953 /DNA_ORIENTATION=-
MTSYLETATSSQELKVGDTVTWTAADEDVPEGTPGIVIALSTDDPGYFEVEFPEVILEVDGDALQRVEVPKAAVAPTASSQESRFKLGDTVTWTDTDTDVPAGTQGVVIGVSTVEPKIFEVEFPAVILEVSGNNLRPAAPPPPAVPVLPKPTPVERQKQSANDPRDALNLVGGVLAGSVLVFGPQISEFYTNTVQNTAPQQQSFQRAAASKVVKSQQTATPAKIQAYPMPAEKVKAEQAEKAKIQA